MLSSPSIVALDNQPALLQVGDEVPITTSSAAVLSNAATPIVNTIQMRNTGVILKVLPHVHANGSVQLEVDQEISNVVNRRPADADADDCAAPRPLHRFGDQRSDRVARRSDQRAQIRRRGRAYQAFAKSSFSVTCLETPPAAKPRSEIIIFIKTQLIRNSVDAGAVTEEFRDRLQSMRGGTQCH